MLGAATPPQSTLKRITSFATGGDAIHNKLKVADVFLPGGSDKSLSLNLTNLTDVMMLVLSFMPGTLDND